METVTTHKAKSELSKLLARVEAGEEIIIARGNKPIAVLMPINMRVERPRIPGSWKARFSVPSSVFEPLPEEELAAWEGSL
jgi:prevent-host-death family protein